MTPPAQPRRRRWSRSEYYRIADAGMFLDQRVELVNAEIIKMAPQTELHVVGVSLASHAAIAAFGPVSGRGRRRRSTSADLMIRSRMFAS